MKPKHFRTIEEIKADLKSLPHRRDELHAELWESVEHYARYKEGQYVTYEGETGTVYYVWHEEGKGFVYQIARLKRDGTPSKGGVMICYNAREDMLQPATPPIKK